ncbi:hypothetical protein JTE90_000683, partial [Oedothorax gibbosus]
MTEYGDFYIKMKSEVVSSLKQYFITTNSSPHDVDLGRFLKGLLTGRQ